MLRRSSIKHCISETDFFKNPLPEKTPSVEPALSSLKPANVCVVCGVRQGCMQLGLSDIVHWAVLVGGSKTTAFCDAKLCLDDGMM